MINTAKCNKVSTRIKKASLTALAKPSNGDKVATSHVSKGSNISRKTQMQPN